LLGVLVKSLAPKAGELCPGP